MKETLQRDRGIEGEGEGNWKDWVHGRLGVKAQYMRLEDRHCTVISQ